MDRNILCGLEKCVCCWYRREWSTDVNGTRMTDGVAELHCALTDFLSGVRVRLHQRRHPALIAALSVFAPCRLALLLGVHATLRTVRPLGESTLYY